MMKRERAKKRDNIIFLPGLEKRLTDIGLESLQRKKFGEAIKFLEEARSLDPENDEMLIGLVLAYFEAGAFQKAKELANDMLLKGIGDYFQMVDLYLTVLIQLHEYTEIVTTIEALLEEKEIPQEKHDHFITLLQFSKRMADNNQPDPTDFLPEENNVKELNLLSLKSINEQMLVISSLAEKNIRPYMDEIKQFLQEESGNPFLKTMLLTLLIEQEYDKEIVVQKFTINRKIVPTELPKIMEQPRMKEIERELGERLENSDPVLFENIIGMVERTFFMSYPFELQPETTAAWAAGFHILAQAYFGVESDLSEFASEYQAAPEKIEQAIEQIRKIEEISYPNI
jgi:tetratricopeptide (TPR) repeat protein